jgi:hypothetical protein
MSSDNKPAFKAQRSTEPAYERVRLPLRKLLFNNFVGGVVWGVGSVIGATVVVALIGYLIATFEEIPFIGEVVAIIQREIGL